MLTEQDILTSSGKYPDREASPECTVEVRVYAKQLCARVNALLTDIGWQGASVNSGFRTVAANRAAGGATRSAHLTGEAVDLFDPRGKLQALITDELLEKHGLYREDPDRTPGWVHLQTRPTNARTFKV